MWLTQVPESLVELRYDVPVMQSVDRTTVSARTRATGQRKMARSLQRDPWVKNGGTH